MTHAETTDNILPMQKLIGPFKRTKPISGAKILRGAYFVLKCLFRMIIAVRRYTMRV